MRVFAGKTELEDAWKQCARHWLERLLKRLGGDYRIARSENFLFLSEHSDAAAAKSLAFLEQARSHIHKVLGEISPADAQGEHVVLRFTAEDDYYLYISHFDMDGAFAGSGGMFLDGGYQHIAYPQSRDAAEERRTLVHELAHGLLAHLPLPPWINEALAMAFERDLAGSTCEPLSRDLAARHRAYWGCSDDPAILARAFVFRR